MCGIAGIFSSKQENHNSIRAMTSIIKYRGPDDEGFVAFDEKSNFYVLGSTDTAIDSWTSDYNYSPKIKIEEYDKNSLISFGHRRLSILDLSPAGHMPMSDETSNLWITYNGEIYNYLEIRDELIKLGYIFKTQTDTEVIIKSYQEWGNKCLDKFVGMFSLAIYNRKKNNIFLARDRFGIKPLYYWISPDSSFYFGSEIKQFTVCNGWKPILNHQRAYDYLMYSLTDHCEETMFHGVFQLLPGHAATINLSDKVFHYSMKIDTIKWYQPCSSHFTGAFDKAREEFKARFFDSIKLHLRADVQVGSALSGGLDSSSIVCVINSILKKKGHEELQNTFSSVHEDSRYSEKKWMDKVIEKTGIAPHFLYPTAKEMFRILPKLIWHMDEPYQSQSAFLGFKVFEEAKKNKVTVLLNGQGADEYLSGYGQFRELRLMHKAYKLNIRAIKKELNTTHWDAFMVSIKYIFLGLFQKIPYSIRPFLALRSTANKRTNALLNKTKLKYRYIHPFSLYQPDTTSLKGISIAKLLSNPLPRYLRWEDRNSMAHSVEARVPFLDHRLVEYCHSLPLDYLDQNNQTKRILIEAMQGVLPEAVRNRKDKQGFITPEERWIKNDYTSEFRELLVKSIGFSKGIIKENALTYFDNVVSGDEKFDYTYWRLILFGYWVDTFKIELE